MTSIEMMTLVVVVVKMRKLMMASFFFSGPVALQCTARAAPGAPLLTHGLQRLGVPLVLGEPLSLAEPGAGRAWRHLRQNHRLGLERLGGEPQRVTFCFVVDVQFPAHAVPDDATGG